MIKVSVFYPNSKGAKFDMAYYTTRHMPMVKRLVSSCKSIAAEQGVAGGAPGTPATYIAIGHLTFDSVEAFQDGFTPHAGEILGDIPNYTNVEPVLQISQITL
jgi:uncharacterized protein (TIGR02118 family)